MNAWLHFSAQYGGVLFAVAICVILVAVAALQRSRQVKSNKHRRLGFAVSFLVLGLALLSLGGFGSWLKTDAGNRWHINRLVSSGDVDRAIEMVGEPQEYYLVRDAMIESGCTDFTRLLDKSLDTPYWFAVYEAQVNKDPDRALDYATAQPDSRMRKALLDAVFKDPRGPRIADDYLITNRPAFFETLLASYQNDVDSIEERLYSCALRSAMRHDRLDLAKTLLERVSNDVWRVEVMTTLGTTLAKDGDIESGTALLSQALLVAETIRTEAEWLRSIIMIASTLETIGAGPEQFLSRVSDIRASLMRCAERRELMQDPFGWAASLANEFRLYCYLGEPDEASRMIAEAREYVESITDPKRKSLLIYAWNEYQQLPASHKIPAFEPSR